MTPLEFIRHLKSVLEDQYTISDREMCEQIVTECARFLRESREKTEAGIAAPHRLGETIWN